MSDKSEIEKKILVVTEQEIAKNLKPVNNLPIRKWKVYLHEVDETGANAIMNYVDKVEYQLHPTFNPWKRVVKKAPFALSEKGWGEFDMRITLYFADKAVPPRTIDHDLNFLKPRYEVAHSLTFVDPKPTFLRLLEHKDSKPGGRPQKRKTSSTVEPSKKAVADDQPKRRLTTDDKSTKRRAVPEEPRRRSPKVSRSASDEPLTPNIGAFSPENEVFAGPASPEEEEYEAPMETTTGSLRASPPSSSKATATPTPPKSSPASPDELYAADCSRSMSVNVEALANNLYMLNGDDVLDLIDLINDHRTAGMYINTDVEGEFHFDLLTMSDDLLNRLWQFTQDRLHTSPV